MILALGGPRVAHLPSLSLSLSRGKRWGGRGKGGVVGLDWQLPHWIFLVSRVFRRFPGAFSAGACAGQGESQHPMPAWTELLLSVFCIGLPCMIPLGKGFCCFKKAYKPGNLQVPSSPDHVGIFMSGTVSSAGEAQSWTLPSESRTGREAGQGRGSSATQELFWPRENSLVPTLSRGGGHVPAEAAEARKSAAVGQESGDLTSSASSVPSSLCHLEQVVKPLWTSVLLSHRLLLRTK